MTTQLDDGNIRVAIQILCSKEQPIQNLFWIPLQNSRLSTLHLKSSWIYHLQKTNHLAFQANEQDIARASRSIPAGSFGGPEYAHYISWTCLTSTRLVMQFFPQLPLTLTSCWKLLAQRLRHIISLKKEVRGISSYC